MQHTTAESDTFSCTFHNKSKHFFNIICSGNQSKLRHTTNRCHGNKALRYSSDNDANEIEDSSEPVVTLTEGHSKEDNANGEGKAHEHVHDVFHLNSQGCLRGHRGLSQSRYTTNNCLTTYADDNALRGPCYTSNLVNALHARR